MSTYAPIASQTLGSAASSVTFSSIPQGYTDLVCILTGTASSNNSNTYLQFNGDTSSLYSATYLGGDGSVASSGKQSNQTKMLLDGPAYWNTAQGPNKIVNIQNYSNSTTFKTVLTRANSNLGTDALTGLYRSTNPVTRITFLIDSNYAAGSTFSLYGIQVGDKAQKAQGGNIVNSDGTYIYHAFTSSGSFIPNEAISADVLVVAGGGGGGYNTGGGGGAGGYRLLSSQSLTAKSYPVIVGAGGAGGPTSTQTGLNGSNSVFGSISSTGGGGGAGSVTTSNGFGGNAGGSGGGASRGAINAQNGGAGNAGNYSPVEGYAGGNNGSQGTSGGGGGAGAVGGNAGASAGSGGAGSNSASTWLSATNLGVSGYLAGGGGGGSYDGPAGAGGSGGGGAGSRDNVAAAGNGVTNTGSGGGGANNNSVPSGVAGSGGSGIVIIRYAL